MRDQRGFTLIELLIVIAIIAILAAAVFVALDPVQRFQESRDAKRWSDTENILNAIKVDQVDNGGSYATTVAAMTAGSAYQIGTAGSGCDSGCTAKTTAAACVDLASLVTDGYFGAVPMDPSSGTAAETDYYAIRNAVGSVEIGSCDPEAAATISVIR